MIRDSLSVATACLIIAIIETGTKTQTNEICTGYIHQSAQKYRIKKKKKSAQKYSRKYSYQIFASAATPSKSSFNTVKCNEFEKNKICKNRKHVSSQYQTGRKDNQVL